MNAATKLGLYVLGLAGVFWGAVGVGGLTGPAGATGTAPAGEGHGGHAASPANTPAAAATVGVPGGLQVSQDGYTLVPQRTTVPVGEESDLRFTINGPGGRPVTRFGTLHGKKLHLIVARRDLTGFQHLHPAEAGGGVWSVPLTLPDAGVYRIFTDVRPEGAARQLTLGADLTAPGGYRPAPLPEARRTARVDGYEVTLTGTLEPGGTSGLTLSVRRDGRPVTDLQPYLEAYGHLVALRGGDLAYLHVHPEGAPGDGRTGPGPDIAFDVEVPSAGTYRLYLDFQHEGKVRTAEFTVTAGAAAPPVDAGQDAPDGHAGHGEHEGEHGEGQ